ncbi:rDNA transcriptional regulator pol5 [Aristolochia californica]|uniref:rDNA transcriptional regulator pol5 n=1 Tax=Aristolochia californica TaxID=171875 RepID=UPI0035E1A741
MGSKKRRSDFVESAEDMDSPVHELKSEPDMNQKKPKKIKSQSKAEEDAKLHSTTTENLNPMERKKRRKILDKEKHRLNSQDKDSQKPFSLNEASTANEISLPSSSSSFPQLHLDHFSNLSSADASVRKGAVEALVCELLEIQKMYRKTGQKGIGQGELILEAEKDDGMKGWHQDLTYAMGRLIRGASSSRAYSRQGFALGLAVVLSKVPGIKVDTVMKLVVDKIEISSSMKGQEARDCFLGRLFAYGALARSGRIVEECISDEATSHVKNFIDAILSLAVNKHYMREPAAAIILDLIEKLPAEAVSNQVLEAPALNQWFQSAIEIGNPDALLLALKIREKISTDNEKLSSLLPYPFNPNSFFTAEHLSSLLPCFKETTFCQPRVHILWPVLVNMLLPDMSPQEEDQSSGSTSKKHKRSKKCNSSEEEISKNLRAFCEIVVEETLLLSSHDRKHLAFEILLLLLPRMSFSYVPIFLSNRLVLCLMDVLSTPKSWLYKAAQHFLKELSEWIGDDDNRRVEVVVALQTHGYGRFDCITRTHTVKDLVAGFNSCSGCEVFVQRLQKVFLDVCHVTDEPSDQSQTTDENSDTGSPQDKGFPAPSGGSDFLKNWVIDSLPRILKNSKLDHEAKHYLQIEIVEFLTVQGLFSASLGTEVTSFELQKKFQWPKVTTSSALCRMCIEQLQMLLADAQKIEGTHVTMRGFEPNDLGLRFMHLLGPLCNIPSVSLFRPLNSEDDKAFKKLQAMESRLTYEERNQGPGPTSSKIHAMRYLLIQLLLQVLLRPGEFSEAALELVICCKKAFFSHPDLLDDSGEEDEFDKNGAPELMDVLVDTLLSLLPQSSSSMCSAVEQVFRCFCHEITDAGLLRMLQVIKKDLKHGRHQPVNDSAEEDDDEEDLLDVEEAEEIEEDEEEPEVVDTGDSDDHVEEGSVAVLQQVETPNGEDPGSDDESDDGMDDDAMFRMDTYLVRIFKERKNSAAGETAHSQLVLFKLRVLSLLEIYLQKNSGKPQVMTIFSYLVQAFINSHSGESTDQLGQRIGGILQRKLFKAKEYPKGDQIQMSTLETLLEKSLNIASRSRHKMVYSLAKNSTFWILKIMHAKNLSESDLQKTVESFQQVLLDYFDSKKCRLKAAFLKEVFLRHSWLGQKMFGHLLKKCDAAKSEYRQIEALDLVEAILKSCASNKSDGDDGTSKVKFVQNHLPLLAELIGDLLIKPLQKSRKTDVRKFCTRTFRILQTLNLKESFVKVLNPDSFAAFESQSGEVLADAKRTSK